MSGDLLAIPNNDIAPLMGDNEALRRLVYILNQATFVGLTQNIQGSTAAGQPATDNPLLMGAKDPDGLVQYLKINAAGELVISVNGSDIQIGAIEIKDGATDNRAAVAADGDLNVRSDEIQAILTTGNGSTATLVISIGATSDAAAVSDIATASLIALTKRALQSLTTGNTAASTLNTNFGATSDAPAATDGGAATHISLFKRLLQRVTTLITTLTDRTQRTQITNGTAEVTITNAVPASNVQGMVTRNLPSGNQNVNLRDSSDVSIGTGTLPPVSDALALFVRNIPSGTQTVDGSVTAAQGAPAIQSDRWPVYITDGTNPLGSQTNPLRVDPTGTTTQPVSGSVTVSGTVAATQSGTWNINNISGTVQLPTGASTLTEQQTQSTRLGDLTETAPASDTASSGLNGRLQRIAQRLTDLIAGIVATNAAFASVNTSLTGSTFVALTSQACRRVHINNTSGTTISVQQGGSGVEWPIYPDTGGSFDGLTNASNLAVKRTDEVGTQVAVNYRWES